MERIHHHHHHDDDGNAVLMNYTRKERLIYCGNDEDDHDHDPHPHPHHPPPQHDHHDGQVNGTSEERLLAQLTALQLAVSQGAANTVRIIARIIVRIIVRITIWWFMKKRMLRTT